MFTVLTKKRVEELEAKERTLEVKLTALENYLGLKFYNGNVRPPHYRTNRLNK